MSFYPVGPWSKTYPASVSQHTYTKWILFSGATAYSTLTFTDSLSRSGYRSIVHDEKPKPSSRSEVNHFFLPFYGVEVGKQGTLAQGRVNTCPEGTFTYTPALGSIPSLSQDSQKCLLKLVRKTDPGMTILVDVGEARETVSLVKSFGSLAADLHNVNGKKLIERLSKVKPGNAKEVVKLVGEANLTYQLGVLPLISSCSSALQNIVTLMNEGKVSSKICAKYVSQLTGSNATTESQHLKLKLLHTRTGKLVTKFGGTVNSEKANIKYDARDLFGLRGRHITPTIWNLIPYSFVVDYFSNVGQLLELMAYQSGFLVDGWSVQVLDCIDSVQATVIGPSQPAYYSLSENSSGFYTRRTFQYQRTPVDLDSLISAASRQLHLEIPDLRQAGVIGSLVAARFKSVKLPKALKPKGKASYLDFSSVVGVIP